MSHHRQRLGLGDHLNLSDGKGLRHSDWPRLFSLGQTRAGPGSLCTGVSHLPLLLYRGAGQKGEKKQEGKCCAFLQDWRSFLCNWEINTFVKGHSLCHGHTLSLGKIFLSIKVIFHGISLEGQCLRLCLPMQRVWVQSLVGELGSLVPHGQKTKNIKFLKKASNTVRNSIKI